MDHLDTFIGFSIIMLIVAQISSFFVDWYLKVRNIRTVNFGEFSEQLVNALTKVLLVHNIDEAAQTKLKTALRSSLNATKQLNDDLDNKTNIDIDPLPEKLMTEAPNIEHSALVADSLKNAFESVEFNATRKFQNHCRLISTMFAIAICILFHINTFQLYTSLSSDKSAREALIYNQLALAKEQRFNANIDEITRTEIEQEIKYAKMQLKKLEELDLQIKPIWGPESGFQKPSTIALIGCIISGLFAGVGATFWHKIINRLMGVRQSIASAGSKGGIAISPPMLTKTIVKADNVKQHNLSNTNSSNALKE